jgi:hypothetical protein
MVREYIQRVDGRTHLIFTLVNENGFVKDSFNNGWFQLVK